MIFKQYINGEQILGNGNEFKVTNPATEELVATFMGATKEQTIMALESAQEAFKTWSKLSLNERGVWINKLRDKLLEEKETMLDLLMNETGKALDVAIYDYNMLIDCLTYFYEEAKRLSGEVIPDYDNNFSNILVRKPVGVVAAHLAWNFPLLNVGYKLGPVLASGCTCVIKPSRETPLATMYIGKIAEEIEFPKGVINILSGSSREVASVMNDSKIPSLITLIGSTQTGLMVVGQSATSVKHYSLELGGNAPAIVMPNADIKDAAKKLVDLKFENTGQVCVSANRVFVHEDVHDEFVKYVKEYCSEIKLGWGREEGKIMGPLLTKSARDRMVELVANATELGAKVIFGGNVPEDKEKGYYFMPTVLDDVSEKMNVYREEIFGPIMPIMKFSSIDKVIKMANDTEYGLASYVFSDSMRETMFLAERLDFGTVCINEPYFAVNQPHGGLKQSGVGKDCSRYSLEEYYSIKRISIKK